MKTYIIFTPDIADLGGAQLYVIRRAKYLKNKGFIVKIITTNDSPLIIKEFDLFPVLKINVFSSLKYIPIRYRNWLLNEICNFIHSADIIESHTLSDSIFCELIANRLKIKHIIYLLNESKISQLKDKRIIGFFDFKLKRKEIYGISNSSLSLIFERNFIMSENLFINIPFDVNEFSLSDSYFYPKNVKEKDFVIATITRLEKEYLIDFIESVYKFSLNTGFITHLMIFGDSKKPGLINQLKSKYKSTNKIKIYWPGYLNPIPVNLFKRLDCFIGMGTTVVNSIAAGCPTLVIDPRTKKCAGILSKDTNNFAYASDIIFEVGEKLHEIKELSLENRQELSKLSIEFFRENYELSTMMNKMDALISCSDQSKTYYEFKFKYTAIEKCYVLYNKFKILKHTTFNK